MLHEYESKHTLNPAIWQGEQLQPGLRKKLLNISSAFIDFLDVSVNVKDIILIGSNANYNWTEYSDIDLHVVIDYSTFRADPIILSNYMLSKKSLWNMEYPISYKGMSVELFGILENIIVYKMDNSETPLYQIISGNRRKKAAELVAGCK